MAKALYEMIFTEILTDRQRQYPGLSETDYKRSAEELTRVVLTSVRQVLAPALVKIPPLHLPKIPEGISPRREAQLREHFADSKCRVSASAVLAEAQMRESGERHALKVLSEVGVTAVTIDFVIKAVKLEQAG